MSILGTNLTEEQKNSPTFMKKAGNCNYLIENNGFGNFRVIGRKKLK